MVLIRDDTDVAQAFADARKAGFARGQVTSFIHGITPEEVRQMAVAARYSDFHVDAIGCYVNPLRLDDHSLQSADVTDWLTLASNMGMMNGCERIVCWSGTLSKTLGTPNLLNAEEDTFNSVFVAVSGLLEQVRGLPVQVILEPYTAQVLFDPRSCLRMAQKFPGGEVRVVLDAPNIIPSADYAARDARVQQVVAEMAPAVGLVHLKDMARAGSGERTYAPPGRGTLAYGSYLKAIAEHVPEVPVVIESAYTVEEMRSARLYVESVLREYGL